MARILLVDDDPDFVDIIKTVLESEGYEVDSAADGAQAMAKMRQQPPDLVLLDVMMAYVLDGLEVSHEMEQDPVLSQIPVIMVSSIAGSPYAGMFPTDEYIPIDAWLSKPIAPQALIRAVAKHVPAPA